MKTQRTKISLDGADGLKALLQQLPKRVVKKGLRAAMTAGSTPILRAAKSGAKQSKQSGTLGKAIARKIKSYSNGNVAAIVGASREVTGEYKGRKRVPANYIQLVDGDTKPHAIGGGQHPGTTGTHFLQRAYEDHKGEALGLAGAKLTEVLEREAAKLAKK